VYAIGDVASVGTPKAGVFAEGQAIVVAAQMSALLRETTTGTGYDGRGICYMEFGNDMVAKVDVTFLHGVSPVGRLEGPSTELVADKTAFGASRVLRWFGRTWSLAQGTAGSA
jgi:sulfide:quinone oxidoreductase